jgi:hypothetical protein
MPLPLPGPTLSAYTPIIVLFIAVLSLRLIVVLSPIDWKLRLESAVEVSLRMEAAESRYNGTGTSP